ncbi:MAG: hypothetical protein PF570_05565 [Candidatus Cloacimonetes bacterium]|jgi:hypothetical protein|nr:hypothetical protein [Candidatus Cloacimonadota bacterium]
MSNTMPYLLLPPNNKVLLIFVYCGIPWVDYSEWCQNWNVGNITQAEYNAIVAEEKKNRTIGKMIKRNQNNIGTDKGLVLYKVVRAKFEFPEIVDQIVAALTKATLDNGSFELILPESLQLILQKYKLRKFIECGLMVGLQFYEIEHYWQINEPVGIVRKNYDAYKYFLWDVDAITKVELRKYLKLHELNQFYSLHNKIVGRDVSCFLGYFGLQDKQSYNENFSKLTNLTLKRLASMDDASKELYSLLSLGSTQCSKSDKDKQLDKSVQKRSPGLFEKYKAIESERALRLHKENQNYQIRKLHNLKKNEKER